MFRSRSQPSSSTGDVAFHPSRELAGAMSIKRSRPWFCGPSSGSPGHECEADTQRRREKRQRRESSLTTVGFQSRPSQDQHQRRQAEPALALATTSAQFDLFARTGRPSSLKNRSRGTDDYPTAPHPVDHDRIRSTAFWDLRQSIAKNGEGFIHRMREYERSRSKPQNHQKAKDAEKRGRKRFTLRNKKPLVRSPSSDASDDDDEILIFSGESSNHIHRSTFSGQRAHTLNTMDVDLQRHSKSQGPCNEPYTMSPKDTQHIFKRPETRPDDCDASSFQDEQLFSGPIDSCLSESSPSLSTSSYGSPQSSVFSLPLQPSTLHDNQNNPLALPSSRSDKVLAAVNLALANGAGSINDYSSLWEHSDHYQSQSYDSGDLWH